MKKLISCLSAVALLALASGCVMVGVPITGSIYTDVMGPGPVTSNSGASKMGEATATGVLGFVTGDCSIKTAAANGGITKIQHVDSHATYILGVYGTYTTTVYGE
jgi:hypothetical protein